MKTLVGWSVTVYLPEEDPPVRLEGRVYDERDGVLEVRLAGREVRFISKVVQRTLKVDLEYVEGREVWGVTCRVEAFGSGYPPTLMLRPHGGPRVVSRRRYERFSTNLPARLVHPPAKGADAAGETWDDVRLINLSQGGAGVSLSHAAAESRGKALTPGNEVTLQFVASELIRPRTRIVRRDETPDAVVLGLEFHSLSSHDATALDHYLTEVKEFLAIENFR